MTSALVLGAVVLPALFLARHVARGGARDLVVEGESWSFAWRITRGGEPWKTTS